jgi:hypothetical protein
MSNVCESRRRLDAPVAVRRAGASSGIEGPGEYFIQRKSRTAPRAKIVSIILSYANV